MPSPAEPCQVPRLRAGLTVGFGIALARYRKAAGLSQEALAFRCGRHPTYVSQLERAVKSPTLDTLEVLARALDVEPFVLVRAAQNSAKDGGVTPKARRPGVR
jgi:transcriptional regulator with XRE-family HTH domain